MAAPVRPAAAKAYLGEKVVWVPSGTYDPTAPSLAIINGASSLDVTNMFYESASRPSQSTNMAKAPKRLGDAAAYEFVGETSVTIGDVRYSFNPQGAALSTGVKAYETLTEGATGYFVYRRGLDRNTDLATGQFVTSVPVQLGPQLEVPEGDGEGAEWAIQQPVAQTGPASMKKAILA